MAHAAAGPARRRRRDRHRTAAQPRVPVHLQPECSASGAIDVTGLVGRLKRHRHTCVHLRDVCMFNGTLHPWGAGLSRDELRDARTLHVRSPTYSFHRYPLREAHPLRLPEPGSATARVLTREVETRGWSACTPLMWMPTWFKNFGELLHFSVSPLVELHNASLIDDAVLLRPDLSYVWWWMRPKYFDELLQPLSANPLRIVREVAPKCSSGEAEAALADRAYRGRRCSARCYHRLIFCQFRSIFDRERYAPPYAPCRAARYVATRVFGARGAPTADANAGSLASILAKDSPVSLVAPVRVTFVVRSAPDCRRSFSAQGCQKGADRPKIAESPEAFTNLDRLLAQCKRDPAFVCVGHDFGARGLRADIAAALRADVLVGTHGAGLNNALFMRSGAALVEVRPYGFEGSWPDQYLKTQLGVEERVHFYQVSTGDTRLMTPPPPRNATGWVARNGRSVRLPWRTLREVLGAVLSVNGSMDRYRALPSHRWVSTLPQVDVST